MRQMLTLRTKDQSADEHPSTANLLEDLTAEMVLMRQQDRPMANACGSLSSLSSTRPNQAFGNDLLCGKL